MTVDDKESDISEADVGTIAKSIAVRKICFFWSHEILNMSVLQDSLFVYLFGCEFPCI